MVYAAGNYAKQTCSIYKNVLTRFARVVGNIQLSAVTPYHWDMYKSTRMRESRQKQTPESATKPLSAVTVNVELRTLKAAFNTAYRWRLIKSNPFQSQAMLRIPESTPLFFTHEDFQKLVDSIQEPWLKEIAIFAVLTGLRRGEISNLLWEDVDLDRRLVVVRSSGSFKTKSGKIRTVPLSDGALYILDRRKKASNSGHVFEHFVIDLMSHKLKKYIKALFGKNSRLHFHSLRHTFASWLVQSGTDIYAVRQLLGHASVTTTMVYAHLLPQKMHEMVNKISIKLE